MWKTAVVAIADLPSWVDGNIVGFEICTLTKALVAEIAIIQKSVIVCMMVVQCAYVVEGPSADSASFAHGVNVGDRGSMLELFDARL